MKKVHLTQSYALINLDIAKCTTTTEIIQSNGIKKLLNQYITKLYNEKHHIIHSLPKIDAEMVLTLFKKLSTSEIDELTDENEIALCTVYRKEFYTFIELLYDYWRQLQKYGLIYVAQIEHLYTKKQELVAKLDQVNESILNLYRMISQKVLGDQFNVYRQLPAGLNANLLYYKNRYSNNLVYESLQDVSFVAGVVTRPPFIVNTKSNVRQDIFKEIYENPLPNIKTLKKNHYIAFPVKVGPYLAYVYIHRDLLHHGIALSNLFELANMKESNNIKPDLIFIYGIREHEYDCSFYHDKDDDILLGFVSRKEKNDYFGYLKKMLLTLHNVKMIEEGKLPVHGAMAKLFTTTGKTKNIIIIGDSGTGKSETLEAIKRIGKDYITQMKIVFDDMGTLMFNDEGRVVASGTEIGAFVRLDDLGSGYLFEELDRATFLNPSQKNARLVTPVSTYEFISKKHNIDLVLYANNYEDTDLALKLFDNSKEALKTFKEGKRIAKGTTNETGMVKSYFANPFGPVQRKSQTDKMLEKYFNALEKDGVIIGEIYTQLALKGHESDGPLKAAKRLLKYLNDN